MRSFSSRLMWRFALLVTLTTAVVLAVSKVLLKQQIERGLELLHEVEAHELAELLGDDERLSAEAVAERIEHDADSDAALFYIQVIAEDGRVLFRSTNLGQTILPTNGGGETHWTTRLPFLGQVHLSSFRKGPWQIVIGSSLAATEQVRRHFVRVSLGVLAGVAVISLALGWGFSRDTLRPIRAIEATARRIRADNLGERIPVSGGDELASLTRLLNETFDRLQSAFEQVQLFSANVSHELKTPLALVRLNAEKLRTRLADDAVGRVAVEDILEEVTRLNQVIDRLLFLAKAETGSFAPVKRAVEVGPWLQAFGEDARALAEDRGARFVLGAVGAGELVAEPDLLRQLLLNLVTNAVAVSPAGGEVRLEARRDERDWVFEIVDEGPGLASGQIARMFERFVRFPDSSSHELRPSGHGLGLAICKAIAELHGGGIEAENRTDRSGLRLRVRVPAGTE